MSSTKELTDLLDQLNAEDIEDMSEETVAVYRSKLNPYGCNLDGDKKYVNFSLTQWNMKYMEKFLVSAFISYMNRMCDEWKVPEGVPVVPVYEYLKDPTKCDTPKMIKDGKDKRIKYEYEFNHKWMEKRIVVKEFLEEFFQFNPEEHVRSAYRPFSLDNERNPIDTPAGKLAVDHLKHTNAEFRGEQELSEKLTKIVKTKDGKTKRIVVNKKLDKTLKDPTCKQTVREFLPPHDLFGRFKMYRESNYEDLRDFVRDGYCEKPDLELGINILSVHDNEEQADEYKQKHKNDFITEIFTAPTNIWAFFDTWKEQRDNTEFLNDKTIILEQMMKQQKADEILGRDLLSKRIKKTKAKNKIMDGDDAAGFNKWRAQNSTLDQVNTINKNNSNSMANKDIPDNAIQVDVWKIAKGGQEITKEHFYTQAEAPDFASEETVAPVVNARKNNV